MAMDSTERSIKLDDRVSELFREEIAEVQGAANNSPNPRKIIATRNFQVFRGELADSNPSESHL